jgi:ribosomal protein S18 acetylase RimI-like enzyme
VTPEGSHVPPRPSASPASVGAPRRAGTGNPPPVVTWAATAPGLPVGAVSEPTLARADALDRAAAGGVTVRRVRLRELLRVAAIQRQAFPKRLAYSGPTLFGLYLLPVIRFLVAVRGHEVLGCAIGDRSGLDARVINIAVAPAARRQGVAAALLFELEEALPGGDMVLMVQRENTGAHDLYRRVGYVDVGLAPGYYGPGRDGIWMRKPRPTQPNPRREP